MCARMHARAPTQQPLRFLNESVEESSPAHELLALSSWTMPWYLKAKARLQHGKPCDPPPVNHGKRNHYGV